MSKRACQVIIAGMASERLFVYGSLKRGERHHAELRGARFLGEARTTTGYAVVPVGVYQALVPAPGAGSVVGELFEVDEVQLAALDEFEGEGYERASIPVVKSGESGLALAYLRRTR